MASITLQGNPITTVGELPAVNSQAPPFTLTGTDLADHSLADYAGRTVVLNIFPSLDTSVCAASVRRFNAEAGGLDNTVVLCISADLPFAHKRFCETEPGPGHSPVGLPFPGFRQGLRRDHLQRTPRRPDVPGHRHHRSVGQGHLHRAGPGNNPGTRLRGGAQVPRQRVILFRRRNTPAGNGPAPGRSAEQPGPQSMGRNPPIQ